MHKPPRGLSVHRDIGIASDRVESKVSRVARGGGGGGWKGQLLLLCGVLHGESYKALDSSGTATQGENSKTPGVIQQI